MQDDLFLEVADAVLFRSTDLTPVHARLSAIQRDRMRPSLRARGLVDIWRTRRADFRPPDIARFLLAGAHLLPRLGKGVAIALERAFIEAAEIGLAMINDDRMAFADGLSVVQGITSPRVQGSVSLVHGITFLHGMQIARLKDADSFLGVCRFFARHLSEGLVCLNPSQRLKSLLTVASACRRIHNCVEWHDAERQPEELCELFNRIGDLARSCVRELDLTGDAKTREFPLFFNEALLGLLRVFALLRLSHKGLFETAGNRLAPEVAAIYRSVTATPLPSGPDLRLSMVDLGSSKLGVEFVEPSPVPSAPAAPPGPADHPAFERNLLWLIYSYFRRQSRHAQLIPELLKTLRAGAYRLSDASSTYILWLMANYRADMKDQEFRGMFQLGSMRPNITVTSDPVVRAMLARAFAKAGLYDELLFTRIRLASMHDVGSYLAADLMHIAWAFATVGELDETNLLRKVLDSGCESLGRVVRFRAMGEPNYVGPDSWIMMLWSCAIGAPALVGGFCERSLSYLQSRRPSARSLDQLMITNHVCGVWPTIPGALGALVRERREWRRANAPKPSKTALAMGAALQSLYPSARVVLEHFDPDSGMSMDIVIFPGDAQPVCVECDGPGFHRKVRDLDGVELREPGNARLGERAIRRSGFRLARVCAAEWQSAEKAGAHLELLERAVLAAT